MPRYRGYWSVGWLLGDRFERTFVDVLMLTQMLHPTEMPHLPVIMFQDAQENEEDGIQVKGAGS